MSRRRKKRRKNVDKKNSEYAMVMCSVGREERKK